MDSNMDGLEGGEELEALTEPAGWKSRTARHICFQGENTIPAPLHIVEDTVADVAALLSGSCFTS